MRLAAFILLLPALAFAHGGGLNRDGCHNDRKRGGYHCHRAQSASATKAPAKPPVRKPDPPKAQPVPAPKAPPAPSSPPPKEL